ncbi:MAG: response regulator transcription factor [Cyclobacteriaceae bacterium]
MKKIKCLIVDDESIARKGIENYANQVDFLEVVDTCKNALIANEVLRKETVDLIFLDINMPQIKGTDFLRTLNQPPKVIFTTAYSEYALESFEFDVIDYLVKPIAFERFFQAANKALRLMDTSSDSSDDHFFVKDSHKLMKIKFDEVLYIESNQNYVNIVTLTQKHMALMPLKSVIEVLPKSDFIQVSRGCVVAKSKVEAIEGNQLVIGEFKITISRRMREGVLESLIQNNVLKR